MDGVCLVCHKVWDASLAVLIAAAPAMRERLVSVNEGILQLQGTGMVVADRNVERTLFHECRCVAQSVGALAPAVHAVLRGCIHHFLDAALGFTRTD